MWTIYVMLCKDNTFYTGITTDLPGRLVAHNAGKGAKYTRGRGPIRLVWSQTNLTQGQARKREGEIKKLTHQQKELLIETR